MKNSAALALIVMAGAMFLPIARAADDADLSQILELVSKNADAETAAQGAAAVNENQPAMAALLKMYRSYLDQAVAATEPDATLTAKVSAPAVSVDSAAKSAAAATSDATTASAVIPVHSRRIGSLETGSLQTGSLQTGHLNGYPALPDVAPTSSMLSLTAGQLNYKTRLDEVMRQRKLFFMEHPSPYYP